MQLEHLCDIELAYRQLPAPFDTQILMVRPYNGEEGTAYGEGDGTVSGPRLNGIVRWVNHPHRRNDGTMLPDTHGVIKTSDEAVIMFSLTGRTTFLSGVGRQLLSVIFEAQDERYNWLNSTLCVLEGLIEQPAMRARIYSCLHELI